MMLFQSRITKILLSGVFLFAPVVLAFSQSVPGGATQQTPFPPPPAFTPKPLPILLAGGLFLFSSSVKKQDRSFAEELLSQAQSAMRSDAIISMELGQGVETGGVYASQSSTTTSTSYDKHAVEQYDQLVLQFQIEGGNAWAQGIAYGIKPCTPVDDGDADGVVQLMSLEIANMDATMNGVPYEIDIPLPMKEEPVEGGT